ncbi:MAG: UDP-N-acetylmuramate--L-alanine ligase [Alphaproteobacteria bacterium]|nr:UDP-N-acetylmuramate--L-alanine ligase [Alphaproteobacteria bacterium]
MRVPLTIGSIHFIGIGGIGMSGIAEIMHNLGYRVQGSDASENVNVKRLREMGIPIAVGHAIENLNDAQVVVYSSAVKPGNAELDAARARGVPCVRRAEMLAEIMRLRSCIAIAGTNGKTTTTTLVAALLDAGGLDPTVVNGGIINAYGTNARLGAGEWVVVEADESDGTFLRLPARIAIVTNVDPDHLDFYGSFERMREAFQRFVENVPFYGFAVLCIDHPEVQAMVSRIGDRRLITYGFSPQADVRAVNLRFVHGESHFDVVFSDRPRTRESRIKDLKLPMPGEHNVQNAVAALVVARELGVDIDTIRAALASFAGVSRRFTRVGEWRGAAIIDDYAHNPFKIAAALRAARQAFSGSVIAVVQPHRYTRLAHTFEQFAQCLNDADVAIVAPVYAAGEQPIPGIDRDSYAAALRAHGHRNVFTVDGEEDLAPMLATMAERLAGGAIVCLGAGSITTWARNLEAALGRCAP